MAEWLQRRICNPEVASSRPVLTTSWCLVSAESATPVNGNVLGRPPEVYVLASGAFSSPLISWKALI